MRTVSRRPPGMASAQVPHQSGSPGQPPVLDGLDDSNGMDAPDEPVLPGEPDRFADPGLDPGPLAGSGLPAEPGGQPAPHRVNVQPNDARGRDFPGESDASGAPDAPESTADRRFEPDTSDEPDVPESTADRSSAVIVRFIRAGSVTGGGGAPAGSRAEDPPACFPARPQPWPMAMPS